MNYASHINRPHLDQRRALADLLAAQIAERPVQKVFFSFENQRPLEGATVTQVPRLSLPLEGKHPFETNIGDGAQPLRLVPGEALFMLAGSWRRALLDEVRTHTAIVFEVGYVWLFAQHCNPRPPARPQLWCRTAGPIVPEGRDLIHALSAIARSGRNLEAAVPLVRCLVGIAQAQLVDEPLAARDAGEGIWHGMCAYIREHYHRPLDREMLAETFDVHPNHVSRIFSRYGREGFNRFLARTRLENATDLLRTSSFTIEEVALKCGFHDDNYFRYAFRRFFGMPPGQFRERKAALVRANAGAAVHAVPRL